MSSPGQSTGGGFTPAPIDTTKPSHARVYDLFNGGKDNFAVDRAVHDQIVQFAPALPLIVQEQRKWLVRVARFLAGPAGIDQFLDCGSGLPSAQNTHEVVQQVAPTSRIVYVDNDPLVLVHARALLTSTEGGVTDYIDADVRDPDKILQEAAGTVDFTQPVALMMLGILGNVLDTDEARATVNRLVDAVPAGSYLVVNDGTDTNEAGVESAQVRGDAGDPYCLRSPDMIARFFDGLELLEPGVVSTPRWRPDPRSLGRPRRTGCGMRRRTQTVAARPVGRYRHPLNSSGRPARYPATHTAVFG